MTAADSDFAVLLTAACNACCLLSTGLALAILIKVLR